jgi:hypothetical protein
MATLKHLKCSIPNCSNTVGQHSKKLNTNKQVCAQHRTTKKKQADAWKMGEGCNNQGQYGIPKCTSVILDPCQLDINHIDGNNDNRHESNIEVLCSNCHRLVTIRNQHHLQPKASRRSTINDPFGLFTGLINS